MLNLPYRDIAQFEIAENGAGEACFLFGVRKSGSSILNNMCHALADMNAVPYVDIPGVLFKKGVRVCDWQRDDGLCALLRSGNIYGGFRNFPFGMQSHPLFRKGRKVLQVRDPRDALISEYFSTAHSHSLPAGGAARDDLLQQRMEALRSDAEAYVSKHAVNLKRTLREYMIAMKAFDIKLLRYETAIMNKRGLLEDICDFFGWRASEAQMAAILGWADVMPAEERPTEFVRKVLPGDHREKLSATVISQLNELFAEEMEFFGYDTRG